MKSIKLKANAKINIGLNIVKKREDGYHNLETIFYPVYSLYDEIEFIESNKTEFIDSNCDIEEKDNLIIKAIGLLEKQTGKKLNTSIRLFKNIPIGAGMGGGSSDAAFTLIALNKLFNLNISDESLAKIALELGSDVPFFLLNKPALGYSRGEVLKPINLNLAQTKLIIVNPEIHISTGKAFTNIIPSKPQFPLEKVVQTEGNIFNNFKKYVTNDFEEYIFMIYPEIKDIKDKMYDAGAMFSLMSGTGSTVYGFFPKTFEIKEILNVFPDNYLVKSYEL